MAAFQCLLFSNTDTRIRIDDVKYTQDIQNMANKNWCKAVVDRLSIAARLYKKDFAEKGINAPISGCRIFVAVSSTHRFNFCPCNLLSQLHK
jgi:predicted peroxiredoxin